MIKIKNRIKKIIAWLNPYKKPLSIIAITLFFIFGVPPIIHWIVTTNLGIGFIALDKQDSWINFYGAIIGGGITLAGVAWTISEQRKQLREQNEELNNQRLDGLARQYKPYLKIEKTKEYLTGDYLYEYLFENNLKDKSITKKEDFPTDLTWQFVLPICSKTNEKIYSSASFITLKNLGDGEAYIHFDKDPTINQTTDFELNYSETEFKNVHILNGKKAVIGRHSSAYLIIKIDHGITEEKQANLKISIPFHYEDQLHFYSYESIIELEYLFTPAESLPLKMITFNLGSKSEKRVN